MLRERRGVLHRPVESAARSGHSLGGIEWLFVAAITAFPRLAYATRPSDGSDPHHPTLTCLSI
jgi:hypothetical protein